MNSVHKRFYLFVLVFIPVIIFSLLASCANARETNGPLDGNGQAALRSDTFLSDSGTSAENTQALTDGSFISQTVAGIAAADTASAKTSTAVPVKTTVKTTAQTPVKTSAAVSVKTAAATAKAPAAKNNVVNTAKYEICVNRRENVVTVYGKDNNGNYTVPVKAMICSTGINNRTDLGTYKISDKYTWRQLTGGVYGQYASRINSYFLFHSVPYLKQNKSTLETEEYNKLGQQASAGCIRLCVADAKWIYDNCGSGTRVVIYESNDPGPLGKPGFTPITNELKWDPTDPDENNPYRNITGD